MASSSRNSNSSAVLPNHSSAHPDDIPMRQFFLPKAFEPRSPIEWERLDNSPFEIKPELLVMLPRFHGFTSQSPLDHVTDFMEVCSTFSHLNIS